MRASQQEQRSTRCVVGGVALALAVCLLLMLTRSNGSGGAVQGTLRRFNLPVGNRSARKCSLAFIAYEPSEWEEEWRTNAKEYQNHACKKMQEQKHLVDAWMEPMNATVLQAGMLPAGSRTWAPLLSGTRAADVELTIVTDSESDNTQVFSHFRYRDSCSGEEVLTPIEPLVGLLRHPTAAPAGDKVADCMRPDRPDFMDLVHDPAKRVKSFNKWCKDNPKVDCVKTVPPQRYTLENKQYMIMQPLPVEAIETLYPGRKYLFDLGTGRYSSGSLPWFMSIFEAKGIEFDEIFGWEIEKIPDAEYWAEWPPHLSNKMHFRNVPCSAKANDPRNPLNILRRIYRPGDYVAFKLDIDNEPIEQALLRQLDESVISMIAEFFTEIHFDIAEMRTSFGFNLTTDLPNVINEIQGFRMKGLRIHYWP